MRWLCLQLMFDFCRNLTDVCLLKQGGSRYPPPLQQGMWYDWKHKQQKMPKARANIHGYSSTLFSVLIFEDETICRPRTARCVVRNQAETAEDAESTSEHQRIQQYAIFRFNFWRRNDVYTTNCKVCDTIWSINRRRCQKHERTSTYTAVRYFPV